jgi:hypothetical protein
MPIVDIARRHPPRQPIRVFLLVERWRVSLTREARIVVGNRCDLRKRFAADAIRHGVHHLDGANPALERPNPERVTRLYREISPSQV